MTVMRRIVLLIVVALVGAGFAGFYVGVNGVAVNGTALSSSHLRAELAVISRSPGYACYLGALVRINPASNDHVFNAAGAAAWTKIQVEGLSVEGYVERQYHWRPSAGELQIIRAQYANDLTAGATSGRVPCPTSADQALNQLPSWFLHDQLVQNAASQTYLHHLAAVIPLTTAGLTAYYQQHPTYYATTCVSIAYVPVAREPAFATAQTNGLSVAALARRFSVDASAKKGGVYGCYGPSSTAFVSVRALTNGRSLNTFPAQGQPAQNQSGTFILYVAATKRTPNPFSNVANQVLSDVQSFNSEVTSVGETQLLRAANIVISPEFGRWLRTARDVQPLPSPAKRATPYAGAGLAL